MATIKFEGEARIFKHPFMEKLTRTHISIPLIIFYGISAAILIYAFTKQRISIITIIALFLAGILFWTLLEYLIHRFVFHLPTTTPFREKFVHTVHGIHHEYPRDKFRLAMPPVLSITLAAIFLTVFWLLMGRYGFPFGAGMLTGYASYLLVHYSVHARVPPKNFLKHLWLHHNFHHFKNPETAFGVSSPLWDALFATLPKMEK